MCRQVQLLGIRSWRFGKNTYTNTNTDSNTSRETNIINRVQAGAIIGNPQLALWHSFANEAPEDPNVRRKHKIDNIMRRTCWQ